MHKFKVLFATALLLLAATAAHAGGRGPHGKWRTPGATRAEANACSCKAMQARYEYMTERYEELELAHNQLQAKVMELDAWMHALEPIHDRMTLEDVHDTPENSSDDVLRFFGDVIVDSTVWAKKAVQVGQVDVPGGARTNIMPDEIETARVYTNEVDAMTVTALDADIMDARIDFLRSELVEAQAVKTKVFFLWSTDQTKITSLNQAVIGMEYVLKYLMGTPGTTEADAFFALDMAMEELSTIH